MDRNKFQNEEWRPDTLPKLKNNFVENDGGCSRNCFLEKKVWFLYEKHLLPRKNWRLEALCLKSQFPQKKYV